MRWQHIRLALTASALGHDPRRAARTGREMGIAGLQFDARSALIDLTTLSSTGRREFLHILSSQDQQLAGLSAALGDRGLGPSADVDRELDFLDKVMDTARGMATPLVCLDLGPLPEPLREAAPRPRVSADMAGSIIVPGVSQMEPLEPARAPGRAVDPVAAASVEAGMEELGRRADRCGVILAVRSDLSSFAALDKTLKDANCPWFGIDLDPVAILRDAWNLDEVFSRMGGLIRHVRGRDAVSGADRRTRPAIVGRGATPWNDLLADLDAAGYAGWLTIDPTDLSDRLGAASGAVAFLQSLE